MKKPAYLLQLLFLILVPTMFSCVPEDDLGPDTGDPRDKFIGSWLFNETPVTKKLNPTFRVTISYNSGNSSQVLLSNFGNTGNSYSAYGIATSNRITVPYQEIAAGVFVEGSGTMSTINLMDWEYSITAGGDIENFTATATK
jgi:hypothetical protein